MDSKRLPGGHSLPFLRVKAASVAMPSHSQIFLPFEGVPASLGPGLRTVSGAKVSNIDGRRRFAGLEDHINPIDAEFLAHPGSALGGSRTACPAASGTHTRLCHGRRSDPTPSFRGPERG